MNESRRCTARNRDGDPCGRWAIRGGTVCATHGGRAPQTKEAARLRLLAAADPAAATLVKLTRDDDPTVRLRSSVAVLDRAGIGKVSEVEASGTVQIQAEQILAVITGTLTDLEIPFDTPRVRHVVARHLQAVNPGEAPA